VSGPYLTVAECAALLAVDHKTVRRLIERGELPALRVGRALRISPDDLSALAYQPPEGRSTLAPARPRQPRGRFAQLAREGGRR
jgi:excisionase family DNA binding protein